MGPGLQTGRLALKLNALSADDLGEFCRWLDQVEAALDTPSHRAEARFAFELPRSAGARRSWPEPDQPCAAKFEELQATVVAHGKDAWQMVAAGPALIAGGWPTGLGRQLLLAVAAAWRRSLPESLPA